MTRDLEAANDIAYGRADPLDRSDVPTHQQRVIEEKRELDEKARRLATFLASAASAQLPLIEVNLMRAQLDFMKSYSMMLHERLRLWGLA